MTLSSDDRDGFMRAAAGPRDRIAALALRLVATPSPNPPNDTRAVARVAAELVAQTVPGAEIAFHPGSQTVVNLIARVRGAGGGRRLVFSGHLDTYPVGDAGAWTTDPAGEQRRDRLYGRGAADMKGGIAASIMALALLAEHRSLWRGEAVLALAGDEESMGPLGTQHLIETVPEAIGDAVIIGDAGSPHVLRFGEKGFLWIEIDAVGRAAHGAHVHLGTNAIDRLRAALDALDALRALPVDAPHQVRAAIAAAQAVSEPLCGAGEAAVLSSVTVNIGRIAGGSSPNLVPAGCTAAADIRLPVGVSTEAALAALRHALDGRDGIAWRVLRRVEPSFTDPACEIVARCVAAASEVLGAAPAVNMRVGGSDARLFRRAGQPTIVYGPTPHNMGGPDEHVMLDELDAVARVHALTALDFLAA